MRRALLGHFARRFERVRRTALRVHVVVELARVVVLVGSRLRVRIVVVIVIVVFGLAAYHYGAVVVVAMHLMQVAIVAIVIVVVVIAPGWRRWRWRWDGATPGWPGESVGESGVESLFWLCTFMSPFLN
jgi:hypothetical protein